MPPKGWRKGMPPGKVVSLPPAGAPPPAAEPVDAEVDVEEGEGIEAFELPKAPVLKLARAAGPQNMKLAKEVPTALQKASTVFVSYLASVAHDIAQERGEKTLSAQHVLEACKQLDWEDEDELVRVLKSELEAFRRANKAKKDASAATKAAKGKAGSPASSTDPRPVAGISAGGPSASRKRSRADDEEGGTEIPGEGEETEEEDVARYKAQAEDEEEDEEEEEEEEEEEVDEQEEALMEVDEQLGGEGVEDKGLQEGGAKGGAPEE